MGVDTEFYSIIGIKKEFGDIEIYKSKADPEYLQQIKSYTPEYCIFQDYLPDDYIVIRDGMCGEYSILGKVLIHSEYIDEIPELLLTPDKLQMLIDDVYEWFKSLSINIDKSEIKLINFVHFS